MTFYREYAAQVKDTLDRLPWSKVQTVVQMLYAAWLDGRQVFVMGNGGSASTASHMACDLGKNTAIAGQPRLRVMSLNDNMALFSAHSNDNGYENVFAEQLATFVQPGDVVVAISASGNSPNVLNGVKLARDRGAMTIGWSGYEGGALAQLADLAIVVPNHVIEQIEDIHLMLEHMVTVALRRAMLAHVPAERAFGVNGHGAMMPEHPLQSAAD
jgi:D-sedoheptulose 7-phosphate isomerase